jgi:16S rRNA (cytosine967-C5)-methyltransferase
MSDCVKPGGRLLYSTCTELSEENEGVVERFLSGNSGFSPEPFALPGIPPSQTEKGFLTLWPHIHGTDGFFIALLRKKNG